MNWHPIETAPKDGTRFIAVDSDSEIDVVVWDAESGHWRDPFDIGGCSLGDITHWMPLPAPPDGVQYVAAGSPLIAMRRQVTDADYHWPADD